MGGAGINRCRLKKSEEPTLTMWSCCDAHAPDTVKSCERGRIPGRTRVETWKLFNGPTCQPELPPFSPLALTKYVWSLAAAQASPSFRAQTARLLVVGRRTLGRGRAVLAGWLRHLPTAPKRETGYHIHLWQDNQGQPNNQTEETHLHTYINNVTVSQCWPADI